MIRVDKISKHYGKRRILDNVSFEIPSGQIVGLLGVNGAGKSTLLSMIATLLPLDEGEIEIGGHSVGKHPQQVRQWIGYVPQEITLYQQLTVKDNLNFWYELTNDKDPQVLEQMIQLFGLQGSMQTPVHLLSGGMKRRVNIAIAMLHKPKVLLLDEPTVGVDIQTKRQVMQTIKELARQGTTIIFISHDLLEVYEVCDRAILLHESKLMYDGSIQSIEHLQEILFC